VTAGRIFGLLCVLLVRDVVAAEPLSAAARLGSLLFADPALSASGRLSCASCHDPANAYAAPRTAGVVMRGGPALDRPGLRTVPSLRYLADTPRFTRHYYVTTARESEDRGPAGGFMRDGRVDSLRAQVVLPLLDPAEMANPDIASVAMRVRAAPYFSRFGQLYGASALQSDSELMARAAESIERFELEDPSFHPYSSRYDQFLAGGAQLTAQELRGLRLFVDPAKGNCAECHPHVTGPGGRGPAFTDFSFHALGVPRNPQIPANRDQRFFDLGLCGPRRVDLAAERNYCGFFKTPSLRNVGRRQFLFHNGRFTTLAEVVRFYVERDRLPQLWYPRGAGGQRRFDDLPAALRGNVNRSDAPLNWQPGQPPALDASEIDDLVVFLRTLDDAQ
jgi:cytochrome c peroxidase